MGSCGSVCCETCTDMLFCWSTPFSSISNSYGTTFRTFKSVCVIHSSLYFLHDPHSLIIGCLQVGDGQPMRLWRVSVEIEAPPAVVLQRVLRERHLWDEDLLHSRVIETLENNTEVFHYITDSMAPHPRRNFIVLRYTTPKNCFSLISLILVPHP